MSEKEVEGLSFDGWTDIRRDMGVGSSKSYPHAMLNTAKMRPSFKATSVRVPSRLRKSWIRSSSTGSTVIEPFLYAPATVVPEYPTVPAYGGQPVQ